MSYARCLVLSLLLSLLSQPLRAADPVPPTVLRSYTIVDLTITVTTTESTTFHRRGDPLTAQGLYRDVKKHLATLAPGTRVTMCTVSISERWNHERNADGTLTDRKISSLQVPEDPKKGCYTCYWR